MSVTLKFCSRCRVQKPIAEFTRERKRTKRYCRPCANEYAKEWRLKNPARTAERGKLYRARHPERYRYYGWRARLKERGVTEEEYNTLLAAQGGACAICQRRPLRRRLCIDHNHRTGKNRGLLCDSCNRAIGLLGDDMSRLATAIAYLEAHANA